MRKLPNVIRNVTSTQTVNLAFAADDIESLAYNATDGDTVCHVTSWIFDQGAAVLFLFLQAH